MEYIIWSNVYSLIYDSYFQEYDFRFIIAPQFLFEEIKTLVVVLQAMLTIKINI